MSGAEILGYLICGTMFGFILKGRMRMYYFTCAFFILGALMTGLASLDGMRGNHWGWQTRGTRSSGGSWYQAIGLGVVLMCGSGYFAYREWPKKKESNQPPENNARDVT
jgi:hypothetical protein